MYIVGYNHILIVNDKNNNNNNTTPTIISYTGYICLLMIYIVLVDV